MKTEYGLIGRKLSHSFSKNFFENKFKTMGLEDHSYHLFEIPEIADVKKLISERSHLRGLNVTIPFKESVIGMLDKIDQRASNIGSVNTIKIGDNGKSYGYNSDYFGFYESLIRWIPLDHHSPLSALVLGSGGASKAVCCALDDLNINYTIVTRAKITTKGMINYEDLLKNKTRLADSRLIVNTTPVGMYPEIDACPAIDYSLVSSDHYVYDLVYNPEKTLFLSKCETRGASIKNGLEMLHLQAEKSWEIWNE